MFKRWKDDKDGNISVILAVSMVPILALVGMAIDLQNTNVSRNFIQYALDNAVIAGSREMQKGKSADDIKAYVSEFLNASIAAKGLGISCSDPLVTLTDGSQDIDIKITCSQPTTLTALIGYNKLDFTVSSGSTYGVGKVDVAFVFDVSGSMDWDGKMDALKDAAADAVDVLIPPGGSDELSDMRIAMVSYSSMMDAGDYFEDVTNQNPNRTYSDTYDDWTYECTSYRHGNCQSGYWKKEKKTTTKTINNTCIKERIGSSAFTDDDPGPNAWFVPAAASYNSGKGKWSEETCNPIPPLPLTDNRTKLLDYIDDLEPSGGTAGHIGIAWGWYMIAPPWNTVWPFGSDALAYDEPDSAKAIVLMTDGEFNTWYNNGQGNSFEQAQTFCDNIKAKGVKIYTVAFNAPDAGEEILAYCASNASFAFTAENAEDLADAYTQIAQSISDLRIRY